MSPRRSSRARTTQHTPSGLQQSNSSSSSMTSGRLSQSVGSDRKQSSQRSSAAARSQSSEDLVKPQVNRARKSQDDVSKEVVRTIEDDIEDESEEDVTRCICGNQDYPGLPVSAKDSLKSGPDGATFAEDATGWFIQCDGCKVWQHGGCVGIMDEATSPEEYFCEQCRKDLHTITTTSNGRKHTLYLPARESKPSPSSPAIASKKQVKRSKVGKAGQITAESISKGRRSTMNSRDAAYEEEQLRLAIEESKREGGSANTATATRKGKRGRSESVERKDDPKRQRTTSGSASSQSKVHRRDSESAKESEKPERSKNIRGAAARNHKIKEARDREVQREKARADSGRKKGRSDRDHAESRSATPEPASRAPNTRVNKSAATSFPAPTLPDHPPSKSSHKKTGRPPIRKSRVGRNQYTKDRDPPMPNDNKRKSSLAPSNSSQTLEGGKPHANGNTMNGGGVSNGASKPSKPRHMNPNKITMNDMRRRVGGILEYISHTQVEMASAARASTTKSSTSTNTPPQLNPTNGDTLNSEHEGGNSNGKSGESQGKAVNVVIGDDGEVDEQAFEALSTVEMMEVLTRGLMKWQEKHGKPGDR